MGKTLIAILGILASLSFAALASAQSISEEELLSAASPVNADVVGQSSEIDQTSQTALASTTESTEVEGADIEGVGVEHEDIEGIDIEHEDIEGVDAKDAKLGSVDLQGTEVEGIESLDDDGPGGSTHEFDGEEEGNH